MSTITMRASSIRIFWRSSGVDCLGADAFKWRNQKQLAPATPAQAVTPAAGANSGLSDQPQTLTCSTTLW